MGKKKNTGKDASDRRTPVTENAYKESFTGLKEKTLYNNLLLHMVLIALAAFIAYSNSFSAPFTFDDRISIVDNEKIKDLGHQLEQLTHRPWYLSSRYIGYLTFTLNYKLSGFDPAAFHVFNFIVHVLSSALVYLFVIYTFRTPFLSKSEVKEYSGLIAFFSGLLFAVHPLQTQAVTYIVQRLASLASFFYLLSVVLYIRWRLSGQDSNAASGKFREAFLYILSLVSAVFAMKTKEISFTLPIIIVLYEFMFFEGEVKKRLLKLVPVIMTVIIIPLSFINFSKPGATSLVSIEKVSRMQTEMSRLDYLFTQFRVIVTYLRLLIFPANQRIDYDYPVYDSFFAPAVFLSFIFLASIAAFGVYLLIRYRNNSSHLRIVSFGIFWFFITLSVESSIIPIVDVIFEHRLYLPSAGFFTVFTVAVFGFVSTEKNRYKNAGAIVSGVFLSLVVVLTGLTWSRNSLWRDNILLWEDNVKKSPLKPRPHYTLANAYLEKGFVDRAISSYQTAIGMKPDDASYRYNLGNAYLRKQLIDNAIAEFQSSIKLNPKHAGAHNNLGNAYIMKGLLDNAAESYETSLKLKPENADATGNLGNIYLHKGLTDKAIQCYQSVLKLKPENADAHFNLGIAYMKKQENSTALEEFRTALRIKPAMKEAEDYINIILQSKNKRQQSRMNE